MTEARFKYMREDFGDLPVKLRHLHIHLNFVGDAVEARLCLEMTALTEFEELNLDAADLEVLSVEEIRNAADPVGAGKALDHVVENDRNRLRVRFGRTVGKGEEILLRTVTRCVPSDHILEGIYRDATPPGAPQQFMSQCQQWGFQRIMPILDDCRAKCTMTTTIEADARYTHLISNGNVRRATNPDGRPVRKPGDPARQVITYENPIPMAPYLFLICVGTWDMLADEVAYPDGRKVRLEYLTPPGTSEGARIPMEILKDSILWIAATQDYTYTGDVYRTICMTKSNFGGMENVGNTTIVTDAALLHEHSLDQGLIYALAVIVHEFEHNQCGSETTMETPFDVWLNEAYTVDVERQYMGQVFDPAFMRLNQVESIRNPLLGPLAIEDSGYAGKIVRDGFNHPDELIDGVTYVKAAEVIRMLRLILGDEAFKAGKALYFSRYRNGNANTDQFFACFEEVSHVSLDRFKARWLYGAGYPSVIARSFYDAGKREYRVEFVQNAGGDGTPFDIPVEMALVDAAGHDLPGTRRVIRLNEERVEAVFKDIAEAPAFASINRSYSFYGTFREEGRAKETLALQTRLDPNAYSRVDAMRQLTDMERIRLLQDPGAEVSPEWLDLYGEILKEEMPSPALKSFFLRVDEQPLERAYATWFRELVRARETLMRAVCGRYREELVKRFMALDTYTPSGGSPRAGVEERLLKQVLLDLIVVDDSPESHRLILNHYRAATTANDRVTALLALNRSSSPERLRVLDEAYESWHAHLSGYANYLRVVAGGTGEDVFEAIERESLRPTFDINQPTWGRALFLPMAVNNKMVWRDEGIRWVADTVVRLAPINSTTASRLLNTFQNVRRLKDDLRPKVVEALEKIVAQVSDEVSPTIRRQALAYLGKGV